MIFGVLRMRGRAARAALQRALRTEEGRAASARSRLGAELGLRWGGRDASFFADESADALGVFSGELYNVRELRRELEAAGRRVATDLPGELVLRAYQRWGEGCQERLNGEWAFAVWDGARKRLFCSRDRFGIEPFYYALDGGLFSFGSRLTDLAGGPFGRRAPNRRAVFDYLVLNRAEHAEETFLGGVLQLEAGCSLLLEPGRTPKKRRYYDPGFNPELGVFDRKALSRHAATLRGLLEDSVRARMCGPHPLGAMLSGGLDSSTITCLADELLRGRGAPAPAARRGLKLFAIPWAAESRYMDAVAGAVQLPRVRIPAAEVARTSWGEVLALVRSAERPLNRTTFFGGLALLRRARAEGVRVLFDGGGGDELLAGYPERYFNVYLNQLIRGGDIPGFLREFKTLHRGRLGEYGGEAALGPEFYKSFLRTQSSAPGLSEFMPKDTVRGPFLREHARRLRASAPRLEVNLPEVLRRDVLALGREYRSPRAVRYRRPFLDHRVAEFVLSLPVCYKIHAGWTKYLLRTAMDGRLPPSVCWRKSKVGGTVPIEVWKGFLTRNRDRLRAVLSVRGFRSADFVDQRAVLARFDELFASAVAPGTTDVSGLWRFVNLELWLRENT